VLGKTVGELGRASSGIARFVGSHYTPPDLFLSINFLTACLGKRVFDEIWAEFMPVLLWYRLLTNGGERNLLHDCFRK
jgi:hypothetical protein